MPLINCPDCENKISDAAPACIHCGRPQNATGANGPLQSTSSTPGGALPSAQQLPPPVAVIAPKTTTVEEHGAQYSFGWLLLLLGITGILFSLNMDTSVGYGVSDRVNNIGLMNDKQNYLIASSVAAVLGVILLVTAKKTRREVPVPLPALPLEGSVLSPEQEEAVRVRREAAAMEQKAWDERFR